MINYDSYQIRCMDLMSEYHIENHPIDNLIKVIEELSELNRELAKYVLFKRGRLPSWSPKDLLNELFDADFTIIQTKKYFLENLQLSKLFFKIASEKIERELDRWDLK